MDTLTLVAFGMAASFIIEVWLYWKWKTTKENAVLTIAAAIQILTVVSCLVMDLNLTFPIAVTICLGTLYLFELALGRRR